jgi:predicted RNase H-like nuclease (RuvC/YqgF family)
MSAPRLRIRAKTKTSDQDEWERLERQYIATNKRIDLLKKDMKRAKVAINTLAPTVRKLEKCEELKKQGKNVGELSKLLAAYKSALSEGQVGLKDFQSEKRRISAKRKASKKASKKKVTRRA